MRTLVLLQHSTEVTHLFTQRHCISRSTPRENLFSYPIRVEQLLTTNGAFARGVHLADAYGQLPLNFRDVNACIAMPRKKVCYALIVAGHLGPPNGPGFSCEAARPTTGVRAREARADSSLAIVAPTLRQRNSIPARGIVRCNPELGGVGVTASSASECIPSSARWIRHVPHVLQRHSRVLRRSRRRSTKNQGVGA